jgi:2-dehydro-3-deoxyphosphooctonate aldolase (KDO 8-P synthase)
MDTVKITDTIEVGLGRPFLLIAGPCVLESEEVAIRIAETMAEMASRVGFSYIFKASYDKANRTSLQSFRGPGLINGLKIFEKIRNRGIPVVSDVHDAVQVELVHEGIDLIQIPAFLCRQTDLLVAAAKTGKPIALKKGQFLSPWDMEHAVRKIKESGNRNLLLIERGSSYGYNNLIVDMRSIPIMRALGCPVIYDATHSVQLPGGAGGSSGGQREFIAPLSRAAVAVGVDGLFLEVHPDPDKALCDGPNSLPLDKVEDLLKKLLQIHAVLFS